ncbi:MAG: hypothetical protein WKG00_40930 [Polyangiaceae bacterium]
MRTRSSLALLATSLLALAGCGPGDDLQGALDDVDIADSALAGDIVWRGGSTAALDAATGEKTSLVVTRPGGVAAGDVLVAAVAAKQVNVTPPAGWTLVATQNDTGTTAGGASGLRTSIFWRKAVAAEPGSYSFGFSAATRAVITVQAYGNVDSVSPIDAAVQSAEASSTKNHATPQLTVLTDRTVLVGVFGFLHPTEPGSSTSTMANERADRSSGNAGTWGLGLAYYESGVRTGGPKNEGSRIAVSSVATDIATKHLLALKPASGPPAGPMVTFRGNTHAHTGHFSGHGSDDSYPDDHFALARDTGFDFYCLTEHIGPNSPLSTPAFYQDLRASADDHTDGGFVGIAGFEYSDNGSDGDSDSGHLTALNLALGVNASAPGMDFAAFFDLLVQKSATENIVAGFNHPGAGGHAGSDELTSARRGPIALTEVMNSDISKGTDASNSQGMVAELDDGWRVAPTCGMDNHGTWNITKDEPGGCRVGVLAPSLTRNNLLGAMQARRTFASRDYDLEVRYQVNGQWMGSQIGSPTTLQFDIQVSDPDTGTAADKINKIQIITEGGAVAATHDFDAHSVSWAPSVPANGRKYFFVRVFNGERSIAIAEAAPVWLE